MTGNGATGGRAEGRGEADLDVVNFWFCAGFIAMGEGGLGSFGTY